MAQSNEYPRLLYRPAVEGHAEEVWGVMCNLRQVADADEEVAALDEGWSLTPPAKDAPIADRASGSGEKRGKTRKGLMMAPEDALASEPEDDPEPAPADETTSPPAE